MAKMDCSAKIMTAKFEGDGMIPNAGVVVYIYIYMQWKLLDVQTQAKRSHMGSTKHVFESRLPNINVSCTIRK